MDIELTIDDLARIDTLRVSIEDMQLEQPQWRSAPVLRRSREALPLEHEAASESFLVAELEGRCRLSDETRLREEERLRRKARKRKRHGGASRGHRHWKRKQQTKEKALDRAYDRDAFVWFKRSCAIPLDITQAEWDRCLAPVFEEHPRKSLRWKRHSWGRNGNIYTLILTYCPVDSRGKPKQPVVVYDGQDKLMEEIQVKELAERALALSS